MLKRIQISDQQASKVQHSTPYTQKIQRKKDVSMTSNLTNGYYNYTNSELEGRKKEEESFFSQTPFPNQKNEISSMNMGSEMATPIKDIDIDRIISNIENPEEPESEESYQLHPISEVPTPRPDLGIVQPVSIKQQIMLNLNTDSMIIGEEVVLEEEDQPRENRKVTNNIMANLSEDLYRSYEHNAEENLEHMLEKKIREKEDPEELKRKYSHAERVSREDLAQFIQNGLRGTDSELKAQIEFQKKSASRTPMQIRETPPSIVHETRIKEEMSKARDSEILKGMRHTVQDLPRREYQAKPYGTLQNGLPNHFQPQETLQSLNINKASIGPDIIRFTHENGQNVLPENPPQYVLMKDLPDYDRKIVYEPRVTYESLGGPSYGENRETYKSKASRGTYGGIGSLVMGGTSGIRLNYQNHLDDLYSNKNSSRYY